MLNIFVVFKDYFYAKKELARMLKLVYPHIEPLDSLSGLVSQIDNGFAVPLLIKRHLTPRAGDGATGYCECDVPELAPFIECVKCGNPPRA